MSLCIGDMTEFNNDTNGLVKSENVTKYVLKFKKNI